MSQHAERSEKPRDPTDWLLRSGGTHAYTVTTTQRGSSLSNDRVMRTEVDALIRRGLLKADARNDRLAVMNARHAHLDGRSVHERDAQRCLGKFCSRQSLFTRSTVPTPAPIPRPSTARSIRRRLTLSLRLRRFHPSLEIVDKARRARAPRPRRQQAGLQPIRSVRWGQRQLYWRPPPYPSQKGSRAKRLPPAHRINVRPNNSRSDRGGPPKPLLQEVIRGNVLESTLKAHNCDALRSNFDRIFPARVGV